MGGSEKPPDGVVEDLTELVDEQQDFGSDHVKSAEDLEEGQSYYWRNTRHGNVDVVIAVAVSSRSAKFEVAGPVIATRYVNLDHVGVIPYPNGKWNGVRWLERMPEN